MIYSNLNLKPQEKQMEWGTLYQIEIGKNGEKQRALWLPCSEKLEVMEGMNKALTITYTKNGVPRISKKYDNKLYLLLSSRGSYTIKGDGYIQSLAKDVDKFKIIKRGWGGDFLGKEKIGCWDNLLIEVEDNTASAIRIRTSGAGYGQKPSTILVINKGEVYKCTLKDVDIVYKRKIGTEVPFSHSTFTSNEWGFLHA